MKKIGRNAPCPCGSGKKYKKCCLGSDAAPSKSLIYQRLSEAHDRLVDKLLAFAIETFGENAPQVAMHEFLLWPESEEEIAEERLSRMDALFWPWFLFNWEYDTIEAEVPLDGPEHRTVSGLYAESHAGRIDPLELRLLDCLDRKQYSFWEALHVDAGKGMTLRDLFLGERLDVMERGASQHIQTGDILFGRVVAPDGVGMIVGLYPTRIPPGMKPDIIALRKRMRGIPGYIDNDALFDWDTEIRELFLDIDHFLFSRRKLHNTDGEPIELHRLVYAVASAQEAFDALCGLCVTASSDELRADAQLDDDGHIAQVEFHWDRVGHAASAAMPNTVLGHIRIDGQRLIAEVNSAARAAALRREIETRLGDGARFKLDEIQDTDALSDHAPDGDGAGMSTEAHAALMQDPEVQAQLTQMLAGHWDSWADIPIPALGNITPREAVKTADGREAVEALLTDAEMERGQDPITLAANRQGARKVRKALDLDAPS